MISRADWFVLALAFSVSGWGLAQDAPAASNRGDVIDAIRAENPAAAATAAECKLLEKMHSEGVRLTKETRDAVARASVAAKADFLRARGDASRKGMYGFKRDNKAAETLYRMAADKGSMEAGYNAALMLYESRRARPSPAEAKLMLQLLQFSSPRTYNVSGTVFGQPTYLAGFIHERGLTGATNQKDAFVHYRASARNQYVPGVAAYLRLLKGALPGLQEAERAQLLAEMRLMSSRWKWMSPEIMAITGDLYAEGWLADEDGFNAQLHWGIAARMGWQGERSRGGFSDQGKDERLVKAIEGSLKNRDLSAVKRGARLEYLDLCT